MSLTNVNVVGSGKEAFDARWFALRLFSRTDERQGGHRGSTCTTRFIVSSLLCLLLVLICVAAEITPMAQTRVPPVNIEKAALPLIARSTVPISSWAVCLEEAAEASGIDSAILQAIVIVESGNHPYAFGWYDRSRTRRSYRAATYAQAISHLHLLEQRGMRFDAGVAQVSSRNLNVLHRRVGISPARALQPCVNLYLAGLILREQIRIHGRTWKAIAGYNGALTYAPRVHRIYCTHAPHVESCGKIVSLPHLLSHPLRSFSPTSLPGRQQDQRESTPKIPILPS
jgi:hypothetical protein